MRSLAIDRSLKQSLVSSQRAWTFRFSFTQLFSSVLALFFLFLSLSLSLTIFLPYLSWLAHVFLPILIC